MTRLCQSDSISQPNFEPAFQVSENICRRQHQLCCRLVYYHKPEILYIRNETRQAGLAGFLGGQFTQPFCQMIFARNSNNSLQCSNESCSRSMSEANFGKK